ncbi:MAG: hypothetical protein AB7O52_11155 [Planctomycetota bacterium]
MITEVEMMVPLALIVLLAVAPSEGLEVAARELRRIEDPWLREQLGASLLKHLGADPTRVDDVLGSLTADSMGLERDFWVYAMCEYCRVLRRSGYRAQGLRAVRALQAYGAVRSTAAAYSEVAAEYGLRREALLALECAGGSWGATARVAEGFVEAGEAGEVGWARELIFGSFSVEEKQGIRGQILEGLFAQRRFLDAYRLLSEHRAELQPEVWSWYRTNLLAELSKCVSSRCTLRLLGFLEPAMSECERVVANAALAAVERDALTRGWFVARAVRLQVACTELRDVAVDLGDLVCRYFGAASAEAFVQWCCPGADLEDFRNRHLYFTMLRCERWKEAAIVASRMREAYGPDNGFVEGLDGVVCELLAERNLIEVGPDVFVTDKGRLAWQAVRQASLAETNLEVLGTAERLAQSVNHVNHPWLLETALKAILQMRVDRLRASHDVSTLAFSRDYLSKFPCLLGDREVHGQLLGLCSAGDQALPPRMASEADVVVAAFVAATRKVLPETRSP